MSDAQALSSPQTQPTRQPPHGTCSRLVLLLAASVLAVGVGTRAVTALLAAATKVSSHVTRLDITSRTPAFGGTAFDRVGPYEILIGRATAVIDPGARGAIPRWAGGVRGEVRTGRREAGRRSLSATFRPPTIFVSARCC
jgi:hypothetical protein